MRADELFVEVLKMSFTGSAMLLLICMFSPITKKYFSADWHNKSYVMTLIFFLFPFSNVIHKFYRVNVYKLSGEFSIKNIIYNFEQFDDKYLTYTLPQNKGMKNISMMQIILIIWFVIAFVLAFRKIILYCKFRKIIQMQNNNHSAEIKSAYEHAKQIYRINKNIPVYSSKLLHSPMLVGVINPKIYLPSTPFSSEELKIIFLHELLHYKRKDLLIKLLSEMLCIVHWYNPFVYVLRNQLNLWTEYSIDEKILETESINMRQKYGLLILKTSDNSGKNFVSYSTNLSANANNLKRRIDFMLNSKNRSLKVKSISVCLLVLFMFLTLTLASCANDSTEKSIEEYDAYEIAQMKLPADIELPDLAWPLDDGGKITCGWLGHEKHYGLDIQSGHSYVTAADEGMVVEVKYATDGYGYQITIQHDNDFSTFYGRLSEINVEVGDKVERLQVIGIEGDTGEGCGEVGTGIFLHYEVRYKGIPFNPIDFYVENGTIRVSDHSVSYG